MKKLLLTVAMSLCLSSPAFAGAAPKAESIVTGDRVVLGDVFDGVTDNADHYLAPAPAVGKTMTLNSRDLARISDAFNLGWSVDSGAHVTIRRATGGIDRYDIQAALIEKMKSDMGGASFDMELSDRSIAFNIAPGADHSVSVEKLSYDVAKGSFTALVSAAADPSVKKEVTGRLYPVSPIPVLKTPMRPGDVIAADDIDYVDMRSTDISPSMMTSAASLVGHTPRHGVSAMKPLMASDIQMPVIVKKGDLVTMVLKNDVLSLTTQGKALENGAEGEAIHVMNSASKQVVDAIVTGAQTVSIRAPQSAL